MIIYMYMYRIYIYTPQVHVMYKYNQIAIMNSMLYPSLFKFRLGSEHPSPAMGQSSTSRLAAITRAQQNHLQEIARLLIFHGPHPPFQLQIAPLRADTCHLSFRSNLKFQRVAGDKTGYNHGYNMIQLCYSRYTTMVTTTQGLGAACAPSRGLRIRIFHETDKVLDHRDLTQGRRNRRSSMHSDSRHRTFRVDSIPQPC